MNWHAFKERFRYNYKKYLAIIFASAFSTAISLLTSGIFNFASFFSGDALTIALTLVQLAFNVFGLIAGVFAYVRLRQYLHSSYVQYEKVRNWTLAFVIFQIISCGFTSALLLIYGYSGISVIMAFLSPISEIFICLAIYFTVLRLRSY